MFEQVRQKVKMNEVAYFLESEKTSLAEVLSGLNKKVQGMNTPLLDGIIRRIGIHGPLIEIGCGKGFFIGRLGTLEPDVDIVGVDLNPFQIEEAEKVTQAIAQNRSGMTEVQNKNILEFDGPKFETATLFETLGYLDDETARQLLQKVRSLSVNRILMWDWDPQAIANYKHKKDLQAELLQAHSQGKIKIPKQEIEYYIAQTLARLKFTKSSRSFELAKQILEVCYLNPDGINIQTIFGQSFSRKQLLNVINNLSQQLSLYISEKTLQFNPTRGFLTINFREFAKKQLEVLMHDPIGTYVGDSLFRTVDDTRSMLKSEGWIVQEECSMTELIEPEYQDKRIIVSGDFMPGTSHKKSNTTPHFLYRMTRTGVSDGDWSDVMSGIRYEQSIILGDLLQCLRFYDIRKE